mmetsp:Transcript_58065/g.67038  ORF Transcript_58065/g.67038 Transcript_58065/m.67038 type:complete len:223 (+) Transcript_58065:86-754(+)
MNMNTTQWIMNVVFFVKVFCCMFVGRKLFLGTTNMTTVAAHTTPTAVATKSISSSVRSLSSPSSSSSSSVTMMAMTAGSRTLIEIGNNANNNNDNMISTQKEFEIDVSYLDGDYDNGLLILRRVVNIDNNMEHEQEVYKASTLLHKISHAVTNNRTTVTGIVVGNVASMMGIVPVGLSGFIPALSILIGMKMKSKGFLSSIGTTFQQKKKKKAQATTTAVIY